MDSDRLFIRLNLKSTVTIIIEVGDYDEENKNQLLILSRRLSGQALLCYSCSSKNNEACVKPDTSEYATVHCDMSMLFQMKNNSKTINKDYENIFDVDTLHPVGVDLVCLKVVVQG